MDPDDEDVTVEVKKLSDDGDYEVTIGEETIVLPKGSTFTEDEDQIGTMGKRPEKYLEVDGRGYVVELFEDDTLVKTIIEGNEAAYGALVSGWYNPQTPTTEGARRRRSRLNRKTRRPKRNGRNTKHRKLRKLTTRRR